MADCVVLSSAVRRRQRCVDSSLWDDRVILITDRGWAKRQNTTPNLPILLGGGGGSALVKWLALPLAGSFFFFVQSQQKEAYQKNKIKT